MKITIESTSKVVLVARHVVPVLSRVWEGKKIRSHVVPSDQGILCRIWEGKTETGIPMHALIVRVGVNEGQDYSQFELELIEQRAPSAEIAAFPKRMIL